MCIVHFAKQIRRLTQRVGSIACRKSAVLLARTAAHDATAHVIRDATREESGHGRLRVCDFGVVPAKSGIDVGDELGEDRIEMEARAHRDAFAEPGACLFVRALSSSAKRIVLVDDDDELLGAIERVVVAEASREAIVVTDDGIGVHVLEQVMRCRRGDALDG